MANPNKPECFRLASRAHGVRVHVYGQGWGRAEMREKLNWMWRKKWLTRKRDGVFFFYKAVPDAPVPGSYKAVSAHVKGQPKETQGSEGPCPTP